MSPHVDTEDLGVDCGPARRHGIHPLVRSAYVWTRVDAALQVAAEDTARLVVVILPDSGRGYLSKVFDDGWMQANGFEI